MSWLLLRLVISMHGLNMKLEEKINSCPFNIRKRMNGKLQRKQTNKTDLNFPFHTVTLQQSVNHSTDVFLGGGGADKFLSPTRKEKTYSDQSNSSKLLKNISEGCPSNQVYAAAMTSASDEKWRPFNCFFQWGRAKDLSAPL